MAGVFAFALLAFASIVASADELLLTQILFRHGDRTPINTLSTLPPFDWPEGPGQLTERGMQMHANLGQYMSNRYVGVDKLVAAYHHTQTLVRSTDVDRTLQSALSQLLTWFPSDPFSSHNVSLWQPIPVHTKPVPIDFLMRPFDEGTCPRYNQLVADHYEQPYWKAKLAEICPPTACTGLGLAVGCNNQAFVAKLGQLAGIPSLSFSDLYLAVDPIFCRHEHVDKTLPAWATGDSYEYMLTLSDWAMFDLFTGVEERRLTGGNLLKEMLSRIDARLDPSNSSTERILLYSAHDTTVAMLLHALNTNHWRAHSPPYASAVILELWNRNNQPVLELYFKNQSTLNATTVMMDGHRLTVPGCPVSCPVSQFKQATQAVIPDDWQAECERPETVSQPSQKNTVLALGVVCGALFLFTFGFAVWWRRARGRQSAAYMPVSNSDNGNDDLHYPFGKAKVLGYNK